MADALRRASADAGVTFDEATGALTVRTRSEDDPSLLQPILFVPENDDDALFLRRVYAAAARGAALRLRREDGSLAIDIPMHAPRFVMIHRDARHPHAPRGGRYVRPRYRRPRSRATRRGPPSSDDDDPLDPARRPLVPAAGDEGEFGRL
jgi:hypothetical protein